MAAPTISFTQTRLLVAGLSQGSQPIKSSTFPTKPIQMFQGDRLPYLDFVLSDRKFIAHDLTGATVVFSMTKRVGETPKVSEEAMTVEDAGGGKVRYVWGASDTESAGMYFAEVEATFSDGRILTFPEKGYQLIDVQRQIA